MQKIGLIALNWFVFLCCSSGNVCCSQQEANPSTVAVQDAGAVVMTPANFTDEIFKELSTQAWFVAGAYEEQDLWAFVRERIEVKYANSGARLWIEANLAAIEACAQSTILDITGDRLAILLESTQLAEGAASAARSDGPMIAAAEMAVYDTSGVSAPGEVQAAGYRFRKRTPGKSALSREWLGDALMMRNAERLATEIFAHNPVFSDDAALVAHIEAAIATMPASMAHPLTRAVLFAYKRIQEEPQANNRQ
jgi:hypothetical protein